MSDFEYGVIGVGSVGSMTLWKLSEQSGSVLGIEGGTVANDNSAVGGDTRLFRRVYREGEQYENLLETSLNGWHELADISGQRIIEKTGMLSMFESTSPDQTILLSHAQRFGLEYEILTADEAVEAFPQFKMTSTMSGFYDPAGSFLRTDVAVRAAVRIAEKNGAEVLEGTPVVGIKSDHTGVTVTMTDRSVIRFDKVVVCLGARAPEVLPHQLASVVEPRRLVMTWFGADEIDDFRLGNFPIFGYRAESDSQGIYGAPTIDGSMVKVSGFILNRPLVFERFEFDQTVSTEERIVAGNRAGDVVRGLSSRPVRATAYADLYTRDSQPIIDWIDSYDRVLLATGFSGKGFKIATGVGAAVASAVAMGSPLDPSFSSQRF